MTQRLVAFVSDFNMVHQLFNWLCQVGSKFQVQRYVLACLHNRHWFRDCDIHLPHYNAFFAVRCEDPAPSSFDRLQRKPLSMHQMYIWTSVQCLVYNNWNV